MTLIDLKQVGDTLVLHVRKDGHSLSAYSLAATLIAFADAAKAANDQVNLGYEIEVVVEALSDGSFKATLRAVYRQLENLFTKQALQSIVFSILATYIYEQTLAPDSDVKVIINTDEVVIEQNDKKIVVPRTVYDATQRVRKVTRFQEKVGQAVDAILKDESVTGISLDTGTEKDKELPPIERPDLERIALPPNEDDISQVIEEIADLQIIRAILEKSRRRWEFSWKGFRIPAPILHEQFYKEFAEHNIVIAPGDTLRARLRIYQNRDPSNNVFVNEQYEIIEVIEHIPAKKHQQQKLE